MSKIGSRIKDLRNEKNMTQEQLAQQLHVTRQAVSSWETGKTQPDIETLTKLASAFGVSAEELIYGESKKKFYILPKREGEHPMFENIAQKIKKLAEAMTWVGCIISLILGFLVAYPLGLLVITPIGCLLSWVGSFTLYGLGQLIENSERCVDLLTVISGLPEPEEEKEPAPKLPQDPWVCYSCGTENDPRVGCCVNCGTTRGWSEMKFQQNEDEKKA